MKFLIAGGTGLVGEALKDLLVKHQHEVHILSRSKHVNQPGITYFFWDPETAQIDLSSFEGVDVLVNLSGAGIADKRWTPSRKKVIIDSRVKPTTFLYNTVVQNNISIKKYITASGINCYGWQNRNQKRTETDAYGDDFLSNVVQVWEESAQKFEEITDVVILRISMVLAAQGGALDQLGKFTKWRIGSYLGDGKQLVQWIHIDDLVASVLFFASNPHKGAYNITADEQTTNKVFMKSLNKVLHKKPLVPPAPKFVLKLMLGEMSEMVLEGIKVSNDKLKETGFQLKYSNLDSALSDIYTP